jgi:O-antigen ligase
MYKKITLDRIYQYLLILLSFLSVLTVFGANLIVVIIVLTWLLSGDYKSKYNEIISNKFLVASIVFFFLNVVGLLWTEDLQWGLHIVHKMWYFLLFIPILHSIVNKKFIKYYILAFLIAIGITEIFSYLIWFELIPPFKNASIDNPTPFMSHISWNPILTIAIYIVLYQIFFNKKITKLSFYFYSFFAITMSINMFITGGRAGQLMYFSMLAVLIFQFFNSEKVKALLIVMMLIPGVFYSAYLTSDLFKERVNQAIYSAERYHTWNNTSVGRRINFSINSFELIKQNPLIGVGTGDFPSEYKKINTANTPNLPNTANPHNMYVLVTTQLGIMGLISFLAIFYYQIKLSRKSSSRFIRDFGVALPILFGVILFSDSYLLGHYTTLVFALFSSFLYKDFEKY